MAPKTEPSAVHLVRQKNCKRDINNKKLIRRWDSERELFYDDIFNHFYAVRPGS